MKPIELKPQKGEPSFHARVKPAETQQPGFPGCGCVGGVMTGLSSKSYWHLSRTLATQTGMTNDWLKSQGLISVRDLWMKAHGYA
jgi:hypothetical protein